jgi:hypothetical protein
LSTSPPPASFDLTAEVSAVLDGTDLTDPREIAAVVAQHVPAQDLVAALTAALDPFVREMVQRRRQRNPIVGARVTGRSAKVTAIRGWWREAMRDRVNVGPRVADWKQLGDCTYDDLLYAARVRWEKAQVIAAAGDRYAELAKLLNRFSTSTVKALPPEAVQPLLFGKAAA